MDRRNFLRAFGVTSAAVAHAGTVTNETLSPNEIEGPGIPTVTRRQVPFAYPAETWDVIRDCLYSKVTIRRNAMKDRHYAFTHAWGAEHRTDDTNMHLVGQLPQPQSFLVQNIGVVFSPATLPAARSIFAERYAMTLWLDQRLYWRAPVAFAFTTAEHPLESTKYLFSLGDQPLIIAPAQQFHVEFEGEPFSTNPKIAFWAVLDGQHARPIQ